MMQGEKDLQNLLSIYAILWDNKKRDMRETVQGEENSNYETKDNDDRYISDEHGICCVWIRCIYRS